jgi:hypothetical protein
MSTEIDALRAENSRVRAENERLRLKLERCQHRAMEIVRAWSEYHELSVLKDQLELAQRPPRRMTRNGYSSGGVGGEGAVDDALGEVCVIALEPGEGGGGILVPTAKARALRSAFLSSATHGSGLLWREGWSCRLGPIESILWLLWQLSGAASGVTKFRKHAAPPITLQKQ